MIASSSNMSKVETKYRRRAIYGDDIKKLMKNHRKKRTLLEILEKKEQEKKRYKKEITTKYYMEEEEDEDIKHIHSKSNRNRNNKVGRQMGFNNNRCEQIHVLLVRWG